MASEVTYCSECNSTAVGAKFCGVCGCKMMPAFIKCPHCMDEISVRSKFCAGCGRPVQAVVKAFIESHEAEAKKGGGGQ